MRLDVFLVEKRDVKTRSWAKKLIQDQKILVNNIPAVKAGQEISEADEVNVIEDFKYVSRAGYKLEKAIEEFDVKVKNRVCLDVGASTGGFTDCLLQNGADHVFGIDVGSGQMNTKLRLNPKVTCIEKINARRLDDLIRTNLLPAFDPTPNLVVVDISFISLTLVLPAVINSVADNSEFVVLVKPQFELGPKALNKRGIVSDNRIRIKALEKITSFCRDHKMKVLNSAQSPIKGGDGNVEYILHFKS
ncbi:MAG: TlyA family RNA methyltransferase [Flavobacteriales bacterium]|nr:TlyA family RNA methyltransferase [Flavobacteriales bacterium]